MVTVVSLLNPNGNMPSITIDDTNLIGQWEYLQLEGSDYVGYFRIVNPAQTSPQSRGQSAGTQTINITVSNGAGRTKTQAFQYSLISGTGTISITGLDFTPITSSNNQGLSGVYSFLEGPGTSLYLTDGSIESGTNIPYIKIAGIDLNATPIDPVANRLISIAYIYPTFQTQFALQYIGPTADGGAKVKLIFTGGSWQSLVSNQYLIVRIGDVSRVKLVSGSTYMLDAFSGASTSSVFYRDFKLGILQLVKASILSTTTQIYVNQPYTFQINFVKALNITQNPQIQVSGLYGSTGGSFIKDTFGRIIGYQVTGTWLKDSLITYPKNYTITLSMFEQNTYINTSGVSYTGTINHFTNINVTLTVAESTNSLQVGTAGSLGDQNSSYNAGTTALFNVNPLNYKYRATSNLPPFITLNNAVGGQYRVKVYGDSNNPYFGNSIINLPNGLILQGIYGGETYDSVALAAGNAGSGVLFNNVPAGTPSFAKFVFNGWSTLFNDYIPCPQPSVPSSTDYSTTLACATNAIELPGGNSSFTIHVQVTEVATGKIATYDMSELFSVNCSQDWGANPLVITRKVADGGTGVQDTFQIMGYYYDKSNLGLLSNTGSYVSSSFPDDGTASYPFQSGLQEEIYIFGTLPYIGSGNGSAPNLPYQDFVYVNITGTNNTRWNWGKDTLANDPTIVKLQQIGCKLYFENSSTILTYNTNPFSGTSINRYFITPTAGNLSNVLTVVAYSGNAQGLYDYSQAAGNLTFAQWNTVTGNKPGLVKLKPININISSFLAGSGGGGGGCVPEGTPLTLADSSTIAIEDVKVGMEVLVLDDITHQITKATIVATMKYENRELYTIVTPFGSLVCSHDHRLYSEAKNDWVPVRVIEEGDTTLWYLKEDNTIVQAKVLECKSLGIHDDVYHVSLSNSHVYIAGDVPAHNMKTIYYQ